MFYPNEGHFGKMQPTYFQFTLKLHYAVYGSNISANKSYISLIMVPE